MTFDEQLLNTEKPSPVVSLGADPEVLGEVKELIRSARFGSDATLESISTGDSGAEVLEAVFGIDAFEDGSQLHVLTGAPVDDPLFSGPLPTDAEHLEAIIQITGRQPLLIKHNSWEEPVIETTAKRLDEAGDKLRRLIPSIGRIDIAESGSARSSKQIGTGWMIDSSIMVTNQHVAKEFCKANGDSTKFFLSINENDHFIQSDWIKEHENEAVARARIKEVLWMSEKDLPIDAAFLKVEKLDTELPAPLELDGGKAELHQYVATIGYPERDPYNDTFVMLKYFENIYGVKRLSTGQLMGVEHDHWLEHDCTTLGGSSGSAVINLQNGKVIGLHFRGKYKTRNLALKASFLKEQLGKLVRE